MIVELSVGAMPQRAAMYGTYAVPSVALPVLPRLGGALPTRVSHGEIVYCKCEVRGTHCSMYVLVRHVLQPIEHPDYRPSCIHRSFCFLGKPVVCCSTLNAAGRELRVRGGGVLLRTHAI